MTPHTRLVILCLLCLSTTDSTSLDSEKDDFQSEEKAWLKAWGLGRRKDPSRKNFLAKKYSAPKFMINLFNELEDETAHSHSLNKTTEVITERQYIKETNVDTVISFFKYVHDSTWNHSRQELKVKFKAKFSTETENVEGGELKIYKRSPRTSYLANSLCRVSVYTIPPLGNVSWLLDTREIRARTSSWMTFNVTNAIIQWAWFPLTNHGLKLVVHNVSSGDVVNPHVFGIVGIRGNLEKRPYLVSFVNTTRKTLPTFTQELLTSRVRRGARQNHWKKVTKPCHLKKFFVNFRKIGMLGNPIIAPQGYHAHFCQGLCAHPLNKTHLTNHAHIQSLANLLDPNIPTPCCAPRTLKPISVLFYDDDNNVVLKRHAEMVVTACKCQ